MVASLREGFPPINSHDHLNMCSREETWQIKKISSLKILQLHYHHAYGHNTYEGVGMSQGAPTHKFTWLLLEVIMWGHVANTFFTCRRLMNTKLRKLLTFSERLPPLNSHDTLTTRPTWGHVTIWENLYFLYHQTYNQ